MSKQTPSNLFMYSPFGNEQAEFYQDLLKGISKYEQLAQRLMKLAEQAHAFRRYDWVKEIGGIISNFPFKAYQAIGHYYLGVAYSKRGSGNLEKAKQLLTVAADAAPPTFRAKAMLSLGAVSAHLRRPDAELDYFTEAIKASGNLATGFAACKGIAVNRARTGDHRHALEDLEKLLPMARFAPPHLYFDYLNSLAVELGNANRKDEARNIMRHVLASPLASAYPEWHETAKDLAPPRRSSVTVNSPHRNVLALPEREPRQPPVLQPKPARVLDLAEWKRKIARRAIKQQAEPRLEEMSLQELSFKLIEAITDYGPDEDQMRAIVAFVLNFLSESAQPPGTPAV
ncbi:MAG: hypothetical protein ACJ74J_09610 [Blastocatellia bacterium]